MTPTTLGEAQTLLRLPGTSSAHPLCASCSAENRSDGAVSCRPVLGSAYLHRASLPTGPPSRVHKKATMRLRASASRLLADRPARQLSVTMV